MFASVWFWSGMLYSPGCAQFVTDRSSTCTDTRTRATKSDAILAGLNAASTSAAAASLTRRFSSCLNAKVTVCSFSYVSAAKNASTAGPSSSLSLSSSSSSSSSFGGASQMMKSSAASPSPSVFIVIRTSVLTSTPAQAAVHERPHETNRPLPPSLPPSRRRCV